MRVVVDGREPDVAHLSGQRYEETKEVDGLGTVSLRLTILDEHARVPPSASGIVFMVGGKVVGRPSFFGLDAHPDLTPKLCRSVVGVVECDALEPHVTADWGALVEGFQPLKLVKEWAHDHARARLVEHRAREVGAARGRLSQANQRRLDALPENRRPAARAAIERLLTRFYGEVQPERIDTIAALLIEAFEQDDYWTVMKAIEEADKGDVVAFAGALAEFGFVEATLASRQARRRVEFLDHLDRLRENPKTLESEMHSALERNLWYFGHEFALVSSNRTMASLVRTLLDKTFSGKRASNRPDLLLTAFQGERHVLIEFKRPSHEITRDDQTQAQRYRDDLTGVGHRGHTDVLVVGGRVPDNFADQTEAGGQTLRFRTYASLTGKARGEIAWLLRNLDASA